MTAPCVPPVLVVSKAARAAWRLRHPFRPANHAAFHGSASHGSASHGAATPASAPAVSAPSAGCEGVVLPEGGRFLPALPGGKPAALAAAAAATGGAIATGAAVAGSGGGPDGGSGSSAGSGPGFGSGGFPGGVTGGNGGFSAGRVASGSVAIGSGTGGTTPLSLAQTYPGPGFDGIAGSLPDTLGPGTGTLVPDAPVRAADIAAPIPAPGVTLIIIGTTLLVVALRTVADRPWLSRRRAPP